MPPPRILLVEDDALVAEMMCEVLAEAGFVVVWTPDGRDALARCRGEGPFDLLLVDDRLPGITGRELIAALRAEGLATATIIHSGSLVLSDAERRQLGVALVIPKPARPSEVVAAIRGILDPRA